MSRKEQPTRTGSCFDVNLRKSDNPYKVKINEPLEEEESLERQLKYVLNRLTPQNFQKLVVNLLELPINTEERLRNAVDIIFDKSLHDSIYSSIYALACKMLAETKVPFEHVSTKFISFLTILLKKCEKEFDTDFHKNKYYEHLIHEAETSANDAERKVLLEKASEQLQNAKENYIGNVKFLGELYNLSLLEENIIHECIEKLLEKETDEENLECLCRLLGTIGKEIEKRGNKEKLNSYFERLELISSEKKDLLASRIRFMIFDLLDLRKANWTPRRENKPRRIDQVRREFEEEQERKISEMDLPRDERYSKCEFQICEGLRYSLYYAYAHHILNEFLKNKNIEHCLKDLNQLKLHQHSELIEALISLGIDQNEKDRIALGEMFFTSLKNKKIDLVQFVRGLRLVLETAVEMSLEGENLIEKLAQVIGVLFEYDYIKLNFLKDAFESIKKEELAKKLFVKILEFAEKRVDHQTIRDILELSDLNVKDLIECDWQYLKENKIEWILDLHEPHTEFVESIQVCKKKLDEIFENEILDEKSISDKIKNEFEEEKIQSKEFIRAFTISFISSCLIHKKFEEIRFKKRCEALKNLVANREDLQLEVLYSVQVLDFQTKYQPGFIKNVFGLLHNEDIVEEDVFWKWKKNPRAKGHAISEFMLKGFFDWLQKSKHEI